MSNPANETSAARALGLVLDYATYTGPPTYYKVHRGRRLQALEGDINRAGYAIGQNKSFKPVFDDANITGRIFAFAYGTPDEPKKLPDSSFQMFQNKRFEEARINKAIQAEKSLAATMARLKLTPAVEPPPLTPKQIKAKQKAAAAKLKGLKRL